MQLFALSFAGLLVTFTLHGCLGRPNREKFIQEAIVGPREQNCRVADFPVQPDFQLDLVSTFTHELHSS